MNPLTWLRSVDSRFADQSKDRAGNFAQRRAEEGDAYRQAVQEAVLSDQMTAEKLAPEILSHLVAQQRGAKAPAEVAAARQQLASVLGGLGEVPTDGTTASRQAVVDLLARAGLATDARPGAAVVDGAPAETLASQLEMARAYAALKGAADPSMKGRLLGLGETVNRGLAGSGLARGAAYGGIAGGGVLGGIGLTDAGIGLLQLAGLLDDEESQAERTA
jgi:hypothetical protein